MSGGGAVDSVEKGPSITVVPCYGVSFAERALWGVFLDRALPSTVLKRYEYEKKGKISCRFPFEGD